MPFGDTPAFDRGIDRGFMMPVGELITSALSNKGNPTGFGQDNTFRVQNAQEVRIVDKNGQVLFSGVGPDAARQAVAVGQNLTDTLGNKAGWTIQTGERTINTDGSVGPMRYFDVANEKVNKSVLGKIADIALPIAAGFIPGVGPVLGAALGSTASSVAQGRGIGETLLRAGLSAGGSALGGQILGRAVPTEGVVAPTASLAGDALSNLPSLLDEIASTAAQNVASAGLSTAAQAVAPSIAGDILATAIREAAPSAVGGAVGSAAANVVPSLVTPQAQVQQPAQPEYTAPPENLIVTAQQPDVSPLFPAVTSGISNTLLDQVINQPAQAAQTQQPAQQEYTAPSDELIVTAKDAAPVTFGDVAPVLLPSVGAALASSVASTATPDLTQTPEKKGLLDRLTANMGITDYLTVASLLGSAVAGGGGGGAATAVPYVSPFGAGAGVGFGAGQDMRVNPNIADYERYAFGPEASFFAPGYSQLVSGAAGAPMQTTMGPQGAMINPNTPTYTPLI